jgi:hypothetical protein
MDEIQIYNYLNRVKPFFKRQEESVEPPVVTGGTKYSGGNAYVTRHCETLQNVGGGVYKLKKGGSQASDVEIMLFK